MATATATAGGETFETNIPSRMDRLPWSRWHWLVVFALGTVWILDGLEVTIVGSIAAVLQKPETLGMTSGEIGAAGAIYVAGAVTGALIFGYLTDRFGRKKLFMITLGLYLIATVATAFSFSVWMFFLFRFLTGMGIGGEYSAINSAIDELIPARVRGWVDIAINGSWWVGTAAGAALSIVLLNPSILPVNVGWRVAFGLGAVLGLGVLLTRQFLPESPRWLMVHGRPDEADEIVDDIERDVSESTGERLEEPEDTMEIRPREKTTFGEIARTMFGEHRSRTILGLSLMSAQAFAYNAVFFTYALVLTTFYKVPAEHVPYYILPFAVGNILGPLLLGRLFDVVGRRVMITLTYGLASICLFITAILFQQGALDATTQTIAWCVIFFFASAGASAAYLTVSEVFPLEIRAMAIAFFYSIATALGGITGPLLFGILVGTGSETNTMWGYIIGAAWLLVAAVTELVVGVSAEQRSLEDVAEPLASEDADTQSHREESDEARAGSTGSPHRGGRPLRYRGMASPRQTFTGLPTGQDRDLDREIAAIEQAVSEGPMSREDLARTVRARNWGPGRFRRALRVAESERRITRSGRRTYQLA
jgi:MFS family permease